MDRLRARLRAIPRGQRLRYAYIAIACVAFLAPFAFLPAVAGNDDLCGRLCMRRFYLYFPGMSLDDLFTHLQVSLIGVVALAIILTVTFFFGRIWCAYLCPVGGLTELVSRALGERWKIDYRALPQVPIRYGYFAIYLVLMPALGISACTLCNFITVPRLLDALTGGTQGPLYTLSAVGLANVALLFALGFLAAKGRAYCQFLCPIGAIDALVHRLGARFPWTRRIRIERSRCVGCNECARRCMTGAIHMEDRVAVIDPLSCMTCHECVDVCDWGALDWTTAPRVIQPKRVKKGVEIAPPPRWQAISPPTTPVWRARRRRQRRWLLALALGVAAFLAWAGLANAAEAADPGRRPDPDGCLVCHALPGLAYRDDHGHLRVASIDPEAYLGSLHGNVPCSDCHRKIRAYPHEPENGTVDCAARCHLEEPSDAEPYTHEAVVKGFSESVHGAGPSRGLTAETRLRARRDQAPGCLHCHRNEPYIAPEDLPRFKDAFDHLDGACGRCHQGTAWLGRTGGHILRRFLGSRWGRERQLRLCQQCHADREAMARVLVKASDGSRHPADARFVLAGASYAQTLHGRLLDDGVTAGAACLDCHAPGNRRHRILLGRDPRSPVHPERRAETCAQAGCHRFATHPWNAGFVATDLHDPDLLPYTDPVAPTWRERLDSPWTALAAALALPILYLLGGALVDALRGGERRATQGAVLGGERFQARMIGRRPRRRRKAPGGRP